MIRRLSEAHSWRNYPAFYNVYPLRNEVAASADITAAASPYGDVYCDDYYGRVFDKKSQEVAPKYGRCSKMQHYVTIPSLEIVDELRVPYRRIPVFKAANLAIVEMCLAKLRAGNPDHQILVRGQTRTYLIERGQEENVYFYGEENVREPSFFPSHLRKKFDAYFLKCMWQSQAAILLNDLGYDRAQSTSKAEMDSYWKAVFQFRSAPHFVLFALGIAQHYGLPSVGLDLTDRLDVACWFATHSIVVSASGEAKSGIVEFGAERSPTVFVFRCPRSAVFDYSLSKPDGLPTGRPDRQYAWFGHVGWGAASNQMGAYLVCGFRLEPEVLSQLDPNLSARLFPGSGEDNILEYFLNMKGNGKYEGEAKRALQGIYYMST